MGFYYPSGAGTAYNTAANWYRGANTPSVHASTSITVTSGGVYSATFTAPNTTNYSVGVLLPIIAKGTAGTIVATLQEYNGATWVDKASQSISITSLTASTRAFFKFSSSYLYTTTTANYYRIKLNTSGASGTTSIAADSGGANFSFLAFDDRTGVPGANDSVYIGTANVSGTQEISLDTSPSIGDGTVTSAGAFRQWNNALTLCYGGILSFPVAATTSLTLKGSLVRENGSWFKQGESGSPIQAGYLASLIFDQNGTGGNYGDTHFTGAKLTIYGADKTYEFTDVVSGAGTTLSPLITEDTTGWAVGDFLVFPPATDDATNYSQTEYKYIKTISTTSITLCDTPGGVESGLTYSHSNQKVFNFSYTTAWTTTNSTQGFYADWNETTALSNVDVKNLAVSNYGSSQASPKNNFAVCQTANEMMQINHVSFYNAISGLFVATNNRDVQTLSYWMFAKSSATGNSGLVQIALANKTLNYIIAIDSQSAGIFALGSTGDTFYRCEAYACGRASATAYGGIAALNNTKNKFIECKAGANRTYGTNLNGASLDFIDCEFGTFNNGVSDIFPVADGYSDALLDNCLFGSTTLISGYPSMSAGSEIRFHNINQDASGMNHRVYYSTGILYASGPDLSDTTTVFTDHYSVKLAGESTTTGAYWEYKILARPDYYVASNGLIQKNASMVGSDVVVEYYAPGLTPGVDSPTSSYTMPDNTSLNPYSLGAIYSGDIYDVATIRISALTSTAGAYAYVGRVSNGTNPLTAIDTWVKAKPIEYLYPELGDPDAVWAVLTSSFTTSGTVGKLVKDAYSFILYLMGR